MRGRLILSAILIVCGALTGLVAADGARRRLRLLGRLTEAVRLLRVRMLERAEPLRSALERTEEETFGEIARAMDDLTDASAAWRLSAWDLWRNTWMPEPSLHRHPRSRSSAHLRTMSIWMEILCMQAIWTYVSAQYRSGRSTRHIL